MRVLTARPEPKRRLKILVVSNFLITYPTSRPVSNDFFLLLHFKRLGGQRFEGDEELKTAVVNWFDSQATDVCGEGLMKVV